LDSFQEKSLNAAVTKYLFSVNSDLKLSRAAATHPEVLKYYKAKGDKAFKEIFMKENGTWRDAIIGEIEKDEKTIHVELKVQNSMEFDLGEKNKRFQLYAVSADDGNSWFFVEEKDYKSKNCGTFKRLIP
jgi:hypothetical protein